MEEIISLEVASSTSFVATSTILQDEVSDVETIKILQTETGWLNVRALPDKNARILLQVHPGDEYVVHERQTSWVAIVLPDGAIGWVFDIYVTNL